MKIFPKKHSGALFTLVFLSAALSIISAMKDDFAAAADDTITIAGKVLAPPIKPIVIGKAVCADKKLSVNLDWPTDENSESFDIKRDGAILATGIIDSEYDDLDVSDDSSHVYQVIAHGPMGPGSAASDEITVSTPDKCHPDKPVHSHKIETLENKPVGHYGNNPKITERAPLFTGKTDIPNAKIEITLEGSPTIYQVVFANINGFWSWKSPEALDFGVHTLKATAIDPNDSASVTISSFSFEIVRNTSGDGGGSGNNNNNNNNSSSSNDNSAPFLPAIHQEAELLTNTAGNPPFQMVVEVENFNHFVFVGEDLSLHIDFSKKAAFLEDKDYQIFYEVINANNKTVYIDSEYLNIFRNRELNKKIPFSALASLGEYRVRVKAYDGKNLIAGENRFTVKDLPLFNVGFCTLSMAQIIQNFAWIIIFILLAFWFLLGRERHESEEGIYQMTEKYLKKSGFFSKKND